MTPINFVVVGFGGMGRYHARELIGENQYVTTYGTYDSDQAKQASAKAEGFNVYDSFEAVLADDQVEAILVATPNDSHKQLVIDALRAGKDVVCEKPVMMSVAEFDDVMQVVAETGQTFMVHQNRRWDADFLIVRDLYQTEELGALFKLDSRVHGANGIPGDWRRLKMQGGGMLLDWGVHLLDQLLFLVDSPIKSVSADMSYVLGYDVDDGFMSYIIFENGVRAHVEVGTTNFIKQPRWYVKGFKGTGVIKDWDLSGGLVLQRETEVKIEPVPIQAGQGLTKTMAPPSDEMTEERDLPKVSLPFESFYDNFAKVVKEQAEPIVKNSEVRDVLVLIETIIKAAETGETIKY